jgi:cellulose synthase/poly-beta-1,6-N-acetylglucosamine synthase-like glycosyltransferase
LIAPHKFDYKGHSVLAGKIAAVGRAKTYRVKFQPLSNRRDSVKTIIFSVATIAIELVFLSWLLISLLSPIWDQSATIGAAFLALLACIFIIDSFRLISIASFAFSVLAAKNPVPVWPMPRKKVAFTTAIVPSKEPFEVVVKTLEAMLKVKYEGGIDVWLLDEGNDPDIKKACQAMGVRHFSRKGVEKWNQPGGKFQAKTKHGNYNAWLMAHGKDYDYVLSVDSDHVPLHNYANRMLGYFRDRDVAFVVGPQVYANVDNFITRGAESQSYVFQATIQRAAISYGVAMFVGTNHAYRVSTLMSIGGFQHSITEDLMTGLRIHGSRNPETGRHWKSIYTPDVLAIGEGPSTWTDFFSQQLRWSRGANEILMTSFMRLFLKLPWRAKLHYGLIIWCYPAAALTWTIGIAVSMLYLFLGTTGVALHDKTWLALYVDVLAAQLFLYGWLRKYNVSPHESKQSFGIRGILVSIFAAPIYAYALYCTLARKTSGFVVTPKGDNASPDSLITFKYHLIWAGLVLWFLGYSMLIGNTHPSVKIWSALALSACLTPLLLWQISMWPHTKRFWKRVFSFTKPSGRVPKGVEV